MVILGNVTKLQQFRDVVPGLWSKPSTMTLTLLLPESWLLMA
jgi:hypothetical protein